MNSIEEHQRVVSALPTKAIDQAAELIRLLFVYGGKLLICGNGGSAADAQHLAAELVGRFRKERKPLAAIALTTDTSILTAVGNDYGYGAVFSRQVSALGRSGDCLLAISTSGESVNIITAADCARSNGMSVIALTGASGRLTELADIAICVNSTNTARIQEAHALILHMICEALE